MRVEKPCCCCQRSILNSEWQNAAWIFSNVVSDRGPTWARACHDGGPLLFGFSFVRSGWPLPTCESERHYLLRSNKPMLREEGSGMLEPADAGVALGGNFHHLLVIVPRFGGVP